MSDFKLTDSAERQLIAQELASSAAPVFNWRAAGRALASFLATVWEGIAAARPAAAKGEW